MAVRVVITSRHLGCHHEAAKPPKDLQRGVYRLIVSADS